MVKLLDLVLDKPAAKRVIIPDELRPLLGDLLVVEGPSPFGFGAWRGVVQLEVSHTLFGFASLDVQYCRQVSRTSALHHADPYWRPSLKNQSWRAAVRWS